MADLRKANDLNTQVIDAVRRRTQGAQNIAILAIQEKFLDGKLFTVGFEIPGEQNAEANKYTNRVYVTKHSIEAYGHDEFLFQVVGARHSQSSYDFLANGQVISGCIALIVTLLVVPTYIASFFTEKVIEVPDWISSGWLLILGFYFGKATSSED